jgi:hypothetical protein
MLKRKGIPPLVLAGLLAGPVAAGVFQYAVPATNASGKESTAFLWVPPAADRIRGVLVGGLTLMEQHFASDPLIRDACAAEKLAIVYCVPSLDALFDYKGKDSGALLQKALADLAAASGYREIAVAPLFSYGHSVSSIFAGSVAYWNPTRCFGVLLFKGGLGRPAGDPGATIAGVPVLAVKGQFEEFGPGPSGNLRDFEDRETAWKTMRDALLARRGEDDRHLMTLLVEPGASHFAWSEPVARYVALFIREAAQRRIPDWPPDAKEPVRLNEIDPKTGALTSSSIGKPDAGPAAYADFKGDPRKAFWHLDLELAKASDAFHAAMLARKPQFVTFADPKSGRPIFVGHDLRLRLGIHWVGPDTFRVAGTFLDKAPDKYPKVEGPVGHAEGPVRFRVFCGTVEPVAPDTFRVGLNGRSPVRADILAYHPGDATHRYAEQQGRLSLPARLDKGKPQKITFAEISPLRPGGPPVKLQATSDAGLPVRYYVESGPAVIEGDALELAEIPKRAAFPLKLTVVAYQYGSAVEPLVQSAEPVRQVIEIRK